MQHILNASWLSPKICSKSLFFIPSSTFDTKDMFCIYKLEDLKVLRRSPDLLNNVKIGQG